VNDKKHDVSDVCSSVFVEWRSFSIRSVSWSVWHCAAIHAWRDQTIVQSTEIRLVAIHSHTTQHTKHARLIGMMRSLHKVQCALRVLDTEISIKERVAAWARLGGSKADTEKLRMEAMMYVFLVLFVGVGCVVLCCLW
jgi:hypothetical protein